MAGFVQWRFISFSLDDDSSHNPFLSRSNKNFTKQILGQLDNILSKKLSWKADFLL